MPQIKRSGFSRQPAAGAGKFWPFLCLFIEFTHFFTCEGSRSAKLPGPILRFLDSTQLEILDMSHLPNSHRLSSSNCRLTAATSRVTAATSRSLNKRAAPPADSCWSGRRRVKKRHQVVGRRRGQFYLACPMHQARVETVRHVLIPSYDPVN